MIISLSESDILHSVYQRSDTIVALLRANILSFEVLFGDFGRAKEVLKEPVDLVTVALLFMREHGQSASSSSFFQKAVEHFYERERRFSLIRKKAVSDIRSLCELSGADLSAKFQFSEATIRDISYALGSAELSLRPEPMPFDEPLAAVMSDMERELPQKVTAERLNITVSKVAKLRTRGRRIQAYNNRLGRSVARWKEQMKKLS